MIKPDEIKFLRTLQHGSKNGNLPQPRVIAEELNIHPKRAYSILEKWYGKGWIDCGVSPLYGWLTEEGLNAHPDGG